MSGISSGSTNYFGNLLVNIQGGTSPYLDFLMFSGSSAESGIQWPAPAHGAVTGVTMNITRNSLSSTFTLTLRKNGSNTNLVLTVTSGTTGVVSTGVGSPQVIFNQGDLLDWAVSCSDSSNYISGIPVIEVNI